MTGQWFYPGIPVSSTNKTDGQDITEILLKVALNTINQPTLPQKYQTDETNLKILYDLFVKLSVSSIFKH